MGFLWYLGVLCVAPLPYFLLKPLLKKGVLNLSRDDLDELISLWVFFIVGILSVLLLYPLYNFIN